MTSVSDLLVKHAYSNVWSGPRQDTQYIITPSRVTTRRGVLGKVSLGLMDYNLPTMSNRYSVFVLGDIPPFMIGMREYLDQWVTAEAHCNSNSLLIDVYNQDGVKYPLHLTYFLHTRGGQTAIAIRHIPKGFDVSKGDVFIRWRSAAWFEGIVPASPDQGITVRGMLVKTNPELQNMVTHLGQMLVRPGHTMVFKNGRRIRRINTTTVQYGDYVEVVHDGSVREVIEIPLNDLPMFDSILDNKTKYLLSQVGYGSTIDYVDDVDIHILNYSTANVYDGVYYHHNHVDSHRNVTHRDLSIPTAYVNGIINKNTGWIDRSKLKVEIIIRHSGFIRPLVYTANRLFELFKLPHQKRMEAMVGESATLPEWNAVYLENHAYVSIMGKSETPVTVDGVVEAYGYNAISGILGKVTHKINEGQKWLDLPIVYFEGATVYEYNALGDLLEFNTVDHSSKYPIQNPVTRYVEVYPGIGGGNMGTVFDLRVMEIPPTVEHRAYITDKWADSEYGSWVDVTGDNTKYTLIDGVLRWIVDERIYKTAVRTDREFMAMDFDIERRDKTLVFTIVADGLTIGRGPLTGWLEIPPSEIDVFLNNRMLVEGIDYHVRWPEICIVNKSHLVSSLKQTVHIRARGFCNEAGLHSVPKERGFVYDRMIGKRGKYHSRADKVNVIHLGGKVFTYEEMFNPDGTAKVLPIGYDGLPYQIRHPFTPMLEYTGTSRVTLESTAKSLDDRMENYITDVLNIPGESDLSTISDPYIVVSPVANKLLHDLLDGVFPIDEFKLDYSLDFLLDKLKRYEWLLGYDPCIIGYDKDFVVIHPHGYNQPIELNIYQYRIMDKAVKHMLNDRVSMDRNLVIVEEGFEHDTRYHPHPRRVL